jgi:hypothetical protein
MLYKLYLKDERVEVGVPRLHLRVLGHGSPALPVQQPHFVLKDKCRLYTIQKALSTAFETSVADPHPSCHFDADPDPNFQIKAQNLEKVLK